MIATKSDIINDAFSQLRISGLTVNPSPSEIELALIRLETMAAEFEGRNICINYTFESIPNPATSTGVDLQFTQMVSTNLAVRLIPDFGKDSQTSPSIMELKRQATQSLSNASARTAVVNRALYPDRMATGSGNTFRYSRFRRFYNQKANAPTACSTEQLQLNVIDSFISSWANFLGESETITSFEIKATDGLETSGTQIQNNNTEVFYRAKALLCGFQTVTISIVTTASTPDYADVRTVNFNVIDNLS